MARRKSTDPAGFGDNCIVVLGGRAFRCIMRSANMTQDIGTIDATHFGGPPTFLRGFESTRIAVEYDVLEEISLTDAQAATIRETVAAGEVQPPTRRGISFGTL